MKTYKKWSSAERAKSLRLTNKAKAMGLLDVPKECRCCGQREGVLHTHNKNYDVTLTLVPKMIAGTATEQEVRQVKDSLVPVCRRCHMVYHSKESRPDAYKKYIGEVKDENQFPPQYLRNLDALE